MKRLYEQGITLIALVITIIILLILASVTIGMAISGTGLFDKAKYATETYQNAQNEEERILSNLNNDIDYYASIGGVRSALPSTILYPDNPNTEAVGSAEAPDTITKSNRIVIDNPYPGHNLSLSVELQINGQWGNPNFIHGNGGYGTTAYQLRSDSTDQIVIQAGSGNCIGGNGDQSGHPFGLDINSSLRDSYPFRLVVVCLD